MGNYCCPNSNNESEQGKPKQNKDYDSNNQKGSSKNNKNNVQNVAAPVDFEFTLNGIKIIVKVGDITKEQADAIVSGTDNYVRNRSTSFLTPSMVDSLNKAVAEKRGAAAQEPLENGEVIITGPGNFKNVQSVIHMAIPLWRGGKHKETEKLKIGFSRVLEEANAQNITSIIFTDVAASLFGIPKQYTAEALMQCVREFAEKQNDASKIKTIKFVHKERQTVTIFEEFLKKEVGVRADRVQSEYVDNLQGSKLMDDEVPLEIQKDHLELTPNSKQNILVDAKTKQSINANESN